MSLIPMVVLLDTRTGELLVEVGEEKRLHRVCLTPASALACAQNDVESGGRPEITPSDFLAVRRGPGERELPRTWGVSSPDTLEADAVPVLSLITDSRGRCAAALHEPLPLIAGVLTRYSEAARAATALDPTRHVSLAVQSEPRPVTHALELTPRAATR